MAVAVTVKLFMVVVFVAHLDHVLSQTEAQFKECLYIRDFQDGQLKDLTVEVLNWDTVEPVVVPTVKEEAMKLFFGVKLSEEDGKFTVQSIDTVKWKSRKDAIFTLEFGVDSNIETVVLVRWKEEDVPVPPRFQEPLYEKEFVDKRVEDFNVNVVGGSGKSLTIKGNDEDINDYFEVKKIKKDTTDEYTVSSLKDWLKTEDAVFTLSIEDTSLVSPVETVVIVKWNGEVAKKSPRFEESLYKSKFVNKQIEKFNIKVIDGTGQNAIIKGEDDDIDQYFQVVNNGEDAPDEYTVSSLKDWVKTEDAVFTLSIEDTSLVSPVETVVIVKWNGEVAKKSPRFEESLYKSKFVNKQIEKFNIKVIDGTGQNVIIKGEDDDIDQYFQVVNNGEDAPDEYTVSSLKDWLKTEDAVFTLSIEDTSLVSPVETVVIVKWKGEIAKTPHFEESLYKSEFVNNRAPDIDIKVIDKTDTDPFIVDDGDIREYFSVVMSEKYADQVYTVKNVKDWNKNTDAIFTLRITDSTLTSPVDTVVIIKWKEENIPDLPRFEKSNYIGTYGNGKLSIPEIKLVGDGEVEVEFEDSAMGQIFDVENTNGVVTITKTGAIEPDLEEILLIVIAKRGSLEGSTAVLIKIDADSAPTFDKSSYEGVYDGTNFIVDKITLANYVSGDVVVDSTEGYDKYFKAKKENGIVTIGKTDDFEDLDKSCVWLTLQLIDSDVVLAKTSVFLTIAKESGSSPKFDSCFYQAAYDGDQLYFDLIQVENPDNVEIELSDPAQENLVKVTFVDGRVALEKLAGLDEYTGDQLIVKIKIKTKQRDTSEEEAILVLTIKKRDDKTPYFKTAYKLVEYDSSKSSLASLEVVKGEYGNVKLVEQEYADYVDVKFDKSKVEVTQKKDLLELKKDTLVLTFVVTDAKDAVAGSAVLVVAMKMDVEEASSDSGLVAGIAVLGSLLALFIIASFAFWYFKLRKRSAPYGNMMEDRKD